MGIKKTALTISLAVALAAGVVSAVSAQQNGPGFGEGRPGQMGRGRWDEYGRGFGQPVQRGGFMALYEAIIDQTDLSGVEIMQQLHDGGTLAEMITASGGDVNVIVDAAIANATEMVNLAVENGRLTQEEANELLASAEQRFTEILNTDFAQRVVERMVGLGVLRLAAEQTGLNPREIRQQLQDGSSLAGILTTNDVDVDTFITDVLARVEARLNVRVVDGKLTQERADEILSNLQSTLTERINQSGLPAVEAAP